jgi:hypothetical protein
VSLQLSKHASAVLEVLTATAEYDEDVDGLVSREPLYRFLFDRFGIPDPQSRRVRTDVVRELTEAGLVRRLNVRGQRVQLLHVDTAAPTEQPGDAPVSYDEFASAVDEDLDAAVDGHRRVEQAFLRRFLLAGRAAAPCAFCGLEFPAGLLVAAHVHRRAELSREERLAFDQAAVLACSLGCDSLYERGFLAVRADGKLSTAVDGTAPVTERLALLVGRAVDTGGPLRRELLARHLAQHAARH